jgi:hypothetical protein
MKNINFYEEYDKAVKLKTAKSMGNCIAVLTDVRANPGKVATFTAVFSAPNSDTNFGEVSLVYLAERCKRVSEKKAASIHPRLYERCVNYSKED